jgi:hypothetical protein
MEAGVFVNIVKADRWRLPAVGATDQNVHGATI